MVIKKMKSLIIVNLMLVLVFCLSSRSEGLGMGDTNKYIQEIKNYVTKTEKNKLILVNQSDSYLKGVPDNWIIFKGKEEDAWEFEYAYVWLRNNSIVLSRCFFSSPSQDWSLTVNYYFKHEKLIALESRLATFYGNVIELRKICYDKKGLEVKSEKKVLDLESQKPVEKKEGEYLSVKLEIFRKVTDLPFYKLLKK